MYDKRKALITRHIDSMRTQLTEMEATVNETGEILNDRTRLAVLREVRDLAKRRLADAKYDMSQTKGYGRPDNYTSLDIVKLDDELGYAERLVTSAKFALKNSA